MFLGVPTVLWIFIIAAFSFLFFIVFKILRKIQEKPFEMDSKIITRIDELWKEKKQFNNFKKGDEIKATLAQEGFSETEISAAMKEYSKAKTLNSPMLAIGLVLLFASNYIANFLAPFIGQLVAQILVLVLALGFIIYTIFKLLKK